MYTRSKIIILSTIKYADSDLIVKCISRKMGKLSFLVKGVRKSGKKRNNISYFLPLNVVWATFQYRENKNLLYFKELNIDQPLSNIHQDVKRSSIVLLLAEIIEKAVQEEEVNENMFNYLENSIYWLDTHEKNQNFHIAFLIGFSRFLGIYPEIYHLNDSIKNNYNIDLNVSDGSLVKLHQLLKDEIDITNSHQYKLRKAEKIEILNAMILYYRNMIPNFDIPRSYTVVKDIFA